LEKRAQEVLGTKGGEVGHYMIKRRHKICKLFEGENWEEVLEEKKKTPGGGGGKKAITPLRGGMRRPPGKNRSPNQGKKEWGEKKMTGTGSLFFGG